MISQAARGDAPFRISENKPRFSSNQKNGNFEFLKSKFSAVPFSDEEKQHPDACTSALAVEADLCDAGLDKGRSCETNARLVVQN